MTAREVRRKAPQRLTLFAASARIKGQVTRVVIQSLKGEGG